MKKLLFSISILSILFYGCSLNADHYQVEGNVVYRIFENGKSQIVEYCNLDEEDAAKAYVNRWIYLDRMIDKICYTGLLSNSGLITKKEKLQLRKENPKYFSYDKWYDTYMYNDDSIMKDLKNIFDELPYDTTYTLTQEIFNKAYNNISKELPDLEEGVIYSDGDNYTIWVFCDPLITDDYGQKLGYQVKVKDQGDYASFQYLGKDYFSAE